MPVMDSTTCEDLDNSRSPSSTPLDWKPRTSNLPLLQVPSVASTTDYSDMEAGSFSEISIPKAFLPIVIPQTSRALRGVHYSPFLRAYPTTLDSVGIGEADFICFIDNLNEAFISSPFFYGTMLMGTAVSFVPELAAQIVGGAIATASSFASTANSHARTKLFVKAANKDIFAPRGLQVRLLDTKSMLRAIHVDEETFKLPPLPEFNTPELVQDHEREDPRRRWMQALEGIVAPLEYSSLDFTEQDSWLKKMGAWTAKHQDKRQAEALTKRREKAKRTIEAAEEKATTNQQSIGNVIHGLQTELKSMNAQVSEDPKTEARRQSDIVACKQAIHHEKMKLVEQEARKHETTEKVIAKVDKKEHKVVQKIRWVVIMPCASSEVIDEDIDDGVENVRPL